MLKFVKTIWTYMGLYHMSPLFKTTKAEKRPLGKMNVQFDA